MDELIKLFCLDDITKRQIEYYKLKTLFQNSMYKLELQSEMYNVVVSDQYCLVFDF